MKIMSTDRKKFYEVTSSSCTCPDYVYRQAKQGGKCKHMIKVYYPAIEGRINTAQELKEETDMQQWFRDGADMSESYGKFGEDRINVLINTGMICKYIVKGKTMFYLLE